MKTAGYNSYYFQSTREIVTLTIYYWVKADAFTPMCMLIKSKLNTKLNSA